MRGIDGEPVVNVEVAHIRGALPGSPRYDGNMTDTERASFTNLILVCVPHHKVIDRLKRDDHPVELLQEWKAEAEVEGGLDALGELDGRLDADTLSDMIQEAVGRLGPTREVTVELNCGVIIPGYDIAAISCDAFSPLLDINPHWAFYERVLVTAIRNTGFTDVTLESHDLWYEVRLHNSPPAKMRMMGQNLMSVVNPSFPKRLLAGEATNWYTPYEALTWISTRCPQPISSIQASVRLGSGEKIDSDTVTWEKLVVPS